MWNDAFSKDFHFLGDYFQYVYEKGNPEGKV